jgi:hypothetical protein
MMMSDFEQQWAIDLDWYGKNSRSFTMLAKNSLCEKCRKKLKIEQEEIAPEVIFNAIKKCCGKSEEFITPTLPLQESAFRLFLSNGNKPLTLQELGRQLSERRGIDTYRTAPAVLSRILRADQHYGMRQLLE